MAFFLDNISQHALHWQWWLAFFMDIYPSRLCVVVVVGSLLRQHIQACSALVLAVGILHGHASQQALRCGGCWLSAWTTNPGMLCIDCGCWLSPWTSLPAGSALMWLLVLFVDNISQLCLRIGRWLSSWTPLSQQVLRCGVCWLSSWTTSPNIAFQIHNGACHCLISRSAFRASLW